ncbi:MAG: MFS transporter [Gemmatimonadetes bacterium]|nr:MFS transporter [Gemmatimonadota bacterium]
MEPEQLQSVRSRITHTLFVTQALFGATQVAAFTVVPILAAQLADSERMTGVPMTIAFLARSISAFPFGWIMDRLGRRAGLTAGYLSSLIAAAASFLSVAVHSFAGFCIASFFAGMARSSSEQARFIGAEIYPEAERARIIGRIVSAGTISAIGGAMMVAPAGIWIAQYGYPPMSGPFVVGVGLSLAAVLLTLFLVRPDPLDLARRIKPAAESEIDASTTRPVREILRNVHVRYGIAAMVIGQFVMTLLMVITPLHMSHHDHGTWLISWVIMAHAIGMFGVSGITGRLIMRWGQHAIVKWGVLILVVSCVITPVSPRFIPLTIALFLLGLGWNFCFIAGSSLLSNALAPLERGRVQGVNEMFIALSASSASLVTGFLFESGGMLLLAVIGTVCSVGLGFCSLVYSRRAERESHVEAAG